MIRNIWAVGRNYADHAKELGNAVPQEPMIFLKAGSTAVENSADFKLPNWAHDIHHEVELALEFDADFNFKRGAIALDLTERTIQSELKSKGHPWTLAKSFTQSTPLSAWFNIAPEEIQNLRLVLKVNGETRQDGQTQDMIFSAEILRKYVLERFPVCPGDLLLTGTPAGVGPVKPGDILEAEILGSGSAPMKKTWKAL